MQSILIENQNQTTITGATKILSSTNTQAVVELANNTLILNGNNIEITKLDLENNLVVFNGEINSLKYNKKSQKIGIIKRILK
ncbi:MAG: hypothetical protein IJX00_01270 [Clostridia bacterium]|nr:hypothetical protein [Clostridia bacterium]